LALRVGKNQMCLFARGLSLYAAQRFGALRSGGISKPKRSAKIQISIEVQNLNFALQPA